MPTPYPVTGGVPTIAFVAVYVVAFGPDTVRTLRDDDPDPDAVRDRGSRYVLSACTGGGFAIAILVALDGVATVTTARLTVFAAGLCVTLAGAAVRWSAIRTLGDAFSTKIAVEAAQRVVEDGPYRWVRHPSYTGAMVMFLGLGLTLTDWVSLAVLAVTTTLGYGYRVRVEERALRDELGDAYEEYAERTPHRLVPYVY